MIGGKISGKNGLKRNLLHNFNDSRESHPYQTDEVINTRTKLSEQEIAIRLITYLEDRRVLYESTSVPNTFYVLTRLSCFSKEVFDTEDMPAGQASSKKQTLET